MFYNMRKVSRICMNLVSLKGLSFIAHDYVPLKDKIQLKMKNT